MKQQKEANEQRQQPGEALEKSCSKKYPKIYGKTSVVESFLKKLQVLGYLFYGTPVKTAVSIWHEV